MRRCDECEKKKISMDRMATILSQQSNDWHKQRERIAELESGLQEIIDHAYDNGSHARTMRKIAIGTLEGGAE